ncbi:trypsin-like serine peptidase [Ketogulonicigenium vulgare]|uniref:Peptidase S1 and S6, chymotrypsin/Hap n=1 Tax=Ketogulonicigenium vulgare (strain WSH-001) TaxID=759362 RepID=F9Y9K7_KETVW|nr:trypsin-like serine protease [Ketogulonicigenium vulgare]ADO41372.1 trypsin domain protein [Ketogulonicigenium vulgare Y25]AEM41345.1 Peptidase S1 and S6, chymotrypsin/Hap [Ketogulonicigenium vulgare WSH-001]ALJ81484.1 peptidase S1 [Ketogulonicigenium vulgare]ANW34196.1 peptidase S1 [Ketogulonicigenium vulgare]AOZ55086.1 trypsin domain protein [Ketogulonicigenium vulgare]
MPKVLPVFIAALLSAAPALAQDHAREGAVGRIEIEDAGHCTAVLIAPDQVLTAAHCLFDADTGARIPAQDIVFQAGFTNGRAYAYRQIRRIVIHPDHQPDTRASGAAARSRADLALLELYQPITPLAGITPLPIASVIPLEGALNVIAYGTGPAGAHQTQDECRRIAQDGGVYIFGCALQVGGSGAPILANRGGTPQIVALVSAIGQMRGRDVVVGVNLPQQIGALRAAFDASASSGAEPRR